MDWILSPIVMVTGGGAFRRQLDYENAGLMSEVSTLTRGDTRQLASSLSFSPMWGCKDVSSLSHVWLFVTPWTVAYEAPLSMRFSKQENWSRLPFPFPGDLPNPGIEPGSPALQVDALPSKTPGKPQGEDSCLQTGNSVFSRHWLSQSSDLGLSSLQNCEK